MGSLPSRNIAVNRFDEASAQIDENSADLSTAQCFSWIGPSTKNDLGWLYGEAMQNLFAMPCLSACQGVAHPVRCAKGRTALSSNAQQQYPADWPDQSAFYEKHRKLELSPTVTIPDSTRSRTPHLFTLLRP